MRREVFGVGTYVHIIHRGARGASVVRDARDRARFLKLIRYLNDENVPRNWERDIDHTHIDNYYERPSHWPAARPYVSLLSYCLLDNHFHLLVKELREAGVTRYMQRLSTSMAAHFNARHHERGSLFQGPYKARVVSDDRHMQYLSAYIQVKNAFERTNVSARQHAMRFDILFEKAQLDPYVSLGEYMATRKPAIIDIEECKKILMQPAQFRAFARDVIEGRQQIYDDMYDDVE